MKQPFRNINLSKLTVNSQMVEEFDQHETIYNEETKGIFCCCCCYIEVSIYYTSDLSW